MKRDWDYVTIDDYQSDMRESSDRAVALVEHMKRERDDARLLLCMVIIAAGGEVNIPWNVRAIRLKDVVWERRVVPQYDALVMCAYVKEGPKP